MRIAVEVAALPWMSRIPLVETIASGSARIVSAEHSEVFTTTSTTPVPRLMLAIDEGAAVFLVGPAGAGKSAILDMLSFHRVPTRGRLEILGVDPAQVAPKDRPLMRRRVGLVFQDERLVPELNVFDNVALAAVAADRRFRDYADDIDQLLTWVSLIKKRKVLIPNLTAGERRRLCIARALVNRPEVLLVDEPTDGLSDNATTGVLRLISEVGAAGSAVVFATRNADLAVTPGAVVYQLPAPERRDAV